MRTLSVSEAKMKLSSLVDAVYSMDDEIMITKNGSAVAYMVSPDEYDGWKETLAIKSDAEFLKEIKSGLQKINKGKTKLYTLEELFK